MKTPQGIMEGIF